MQAVELDYMETFYFWRACTLRMLISSCSSSSSSSSISSSSSSSSSSSGGSSSGSGGGERREKATRQDHFCDYAICQTLQLLTTKAVLSHANVD